MRRHALPPLEPGCSSSSEHDSRGPGWYCCRDNRWNEAAVETCVACGHERCRKDAYTYPMPIAVLRDFHPRATAAAADALHAFVANDPLPLRPQV